MGIKDAWVEIFDDTGFSDRRLRIDQNSPTSSIKNYKDIYVDGGSGFGDKASAVRWQIPTTHCYKLYQHDSYGGKSYLLRGTGHVEEIRSLHSENFGDEVSSSR